MDSGRIAEEAVVQYAGPEHRELASDFSGKGRLQHWNIPVLESASELRYPSKSTEEIESLRSRLLWLAALLFLFDVAVRKISFRDIKFPESKPAETALPSSLARLKDVKKPRPPERAPLEAILMKEEIEPEPAAPLPPSQPVPSQTSEYMERLKKAKKKGPQ
jgi:hypothetical protein